MKVSLKKKNIMVVNSISFRASLVTILHKITVKAVLTILYILYYIMQKNKPFIH